MKPPGTKFREYSGVSGHLNDLFGNVQGPKLHKGCIGPKVTFNILSFRPF